MSTFLELTNTLIRRINEVPLTDTSFAAARGMQAVAKDCILDSLREMNQQKWQWPFHNAVEGTEVLVVGQSEYDWPTDFKTVDWNSFQIQKDTSLNINSTHLTPINRDEWYKYLRDRDDDNDPNGLKIPGYVFKSHGNQFGISPSPNEAYTLKYKYYKIPTLPTLHGDDSEIPSQFDNVIIWGGLYHINLFRENVEGMDRAKTYFYNGISNMYYILIGNSGESMTDSRVNFGGQPSFYRENYKL